MHRQTSTAMTMTVPFSIPFLENEVNATRLSGDCEAEVLRFLAQRPLHTVAMTGFIQDNGLVSPLNRGTFYGCRNRRGELEGVALIGHATLMETKTDRALQAFAELARKCTTTHMIMGEQRRIDEFWGYYSGDGQAMRRACRELLFELTFPVQVREEVPELRLATLQDIDLVMPVHAQMAFEESGIDPMETDALGFRERSVRRIQQGRTWVWIEQGKMIFKADVISDTADVIYLEGVWVAEEKRGAGQGLCCMSQLARNLLQGSMSICLLVNENNRAAQAFYERAGFKLRALYDTVFLQM
ncbi:MAG: GNAT family N-acetyltransferase [Pyrinomonadaceae bacterium]